MLRYFTASGKFLYYDYGKLNMAKYKQPTPPEYNLQSVTAPVALFYGNNDPYVDRTVSILSTDKHGN
jgi:hypothetical protein